MRIPTGFQGIAHALQTPQFALYTTGNSVSLVGNWMQRVAVAWLAWELTKSGAWLGLIAFADLFPTAIIAPFAGAAADRWERLRVLRAAQVMAFVQSMTLLILLVTDQLTIWPLFLLTMLLGATQAFEQPARLALIPSLVPARDLSPAIALNSITFNIARFVGPAISGLLIVSSGVAFVLVINALTYLVYFYALMRVRPFSIRERSQESTRFFSEVSDGFRYAINHPGVGPILLLMIIVSMGGRPVGELLPGIADDMFRVRRYRPRHPNILAWHRLDHGWFVVGVPAIGQGAHIGHTVDLSGPVARGYRLHLDQEPAIGGAPDRARRRMHVRRGHRRADAHSDLCGKPAPGPRHQLDRNDPTRLSSPWGLDDGLPVGSHRAEDTDPARRRSRGAGVAVCLPAPQANHASDRGRTSG